MKILKARDQFIAWCACLGFSYVIYVWVYRRLDRLNTSKHHFKYQVALWILRIIAIVLIGWTGYLLKSLKGRLNPLYYGFRLNSISVTCAISNTKKKYTGSHSFEITALEDDRVVFPTNWFRWLGKGKEDGPKVTGKGRHLLALVGTRKRDGSVKPMPYVRSEKDSPDGGKWHRYFIALNPPVQKGERININYSQVFNGKMSPFVGVDIISNMGKLTLKAEFPTKFEPESITFERTKPKTILNSLKLTSNKPHKEDIKRRPYYQNHCVELEIKNPKRGYQYRIVWDA